VPIWTDLAALAVVLALTGLLMGRRHVAPALSTEQRAQLLVQIRQWLEQ
jgi:hypothetical protein